MKHTYIIILASILVLSCGDGKKKSVEDIIATNNLENIRAKRSELVTSRKELVDKLSQLDTAIEKLDTNKKLALVTTLTTKEEEFKHYLEIQGNVATKQNLILYPEFSGILTNIYVKEGQRVSKGQLLAKIDDGGLSQQVNQLKIQATLNKTTFERQERLWNQKIGSEIQYLQAKATYQAQQKAVAQLQQQLNKTIVRAPFSGTIDNIITEKGSTVAPGQSQLMRIVNLSNMYIESNVPESYIAAITKNKAVKVEFPVLGTTINTKVSQVGNYINPANRTFNVEVKVPNKNNIIKPNLTAKLKINDYTNPKAILIPLSIISENASGQQYVYKVVKENNMNVAKKTIIKTGKTQGNIIEVIDGLSNNEALIMEGSRSVKDNQKIDIIKQ